MSEVFGRLWIYHGTNIIFTLSTFLQAVTPNVPVLIALRFIAGCASSAPLCVGAGSLVDMTPPNERAMILLIASTAPLLALPLGPLIGGPLVEGFHWRSTVYFTTAAVSYCFFFFSLGAGRPKYSI